MNCNSNQRCYPGQPKTICWQSPMITISEPSPSLPISISRAQLLALVAALEPVVPVANSELNHCNGGNVVPWDVLPRNIALFHDLLIRLGKRLNLMAADHQRRYRTRLDAFEASMCGMALRAAARTGRTNLSPGHPLIASCQTDLMRTIENHRRRAIRKFRLTVGTEAADELAIELREYQSLLLTDLFRRWPKYRDCSQGLYKQRINRLVACASESLEEAAPQFLPPRKSGDWFGCCAICSTRALCIYHPQTLAGQRSSDVRSACIHFAPMERGRGKTTRLTIIASLNPPRAAPS